MERRERMFSGLVAAGVPLASSKQRPDLRFSISVRIVQLAGHHLCGCR